MLGYQSRSSSIKTVNWSSFAPSATSGGVARGVAPCSGPVSYRYLIKGPGPLRSPGSRGPASRCAPLMSSSLCSTPGPLLPRVGGVHGGGTVGPAELGQHQAGGAADGTTKDGGKKRGEWEKKKKKNNQGAERLLKKSHFSALINGEFVSECGKTGCAVRVGRKAGATWCIMGQKSHSVLFLMCVHCATDCTQFCLFVCVLKRGLALPFTVHIHPGKQVPRQAAARHT